MIINKSVPDISIPFLTGGAAALFASICLPPMSLYIGCVPRGKEALIEFLVTSGIDIVESNQNNVVNNLREECENYNRILNAP